MASSTRRCEEPSPRAMDWAALPHDILASVFLKLGLREVMRSAGFACKSWRRVAIEEPALWRRIEMTPVRRSCRGWRAMVTATVERAAGQCVAFSGPCDDQSLIHLSASVAKP
ncbi:hypothetical protein PR202_gb28577 [Eleusine coracana subsp. coracana]|uniref:F-box domain-containing protein n=1 Tax=Eleusine coracana subsp. coracana TaxID=191504 RepID=A0AAV5FXC7_ELECO|nr:hypothetical protein PR202_gb28577 [Eleusine coracana subsp. coracana]